MIVDAHAHVWSADAVAFPYAPLDGVAVPARPRTVGDLLTRMDAAGVDRVVLIQPRVYGYDHAYLTSVLAAHPARVAGVCLVDPVRPEAGATLRRLVRGDGYRGLRLVGLDHGDAAWLFDSRSGEVWRAAAELGVVVSLLLEPHQLARVARVAAAHPEVRIVVDHLGRCRPDTPGRRDLLALAAHPNVSVKVSAVHALSAEGPPYLDLRPLVAACLAAFGPGRLMWGTDHPHVLDAGPYPGAVDVLAELLGDASGADLARIAGGTAAGLYDLRT